MIIHFGPAEWYPPLQNMLNVLAGESYFDQVTVLTTQGRSNLPLYVPPAGNIVMKRLGTSGSKNTLLRFINYFWFYSGCLFWLLIKSPGQILYFETLSSWPAYLYKQFIAKSTRMFIHYHEYTTPEEYRTAMKLVNYFHKLELRLYPKAIWLSHTNADRMRFFLQDIAPVKIKHPHILPNYPPQSWLAPVRPVHLPLKIVYVGALSLDTMFTKEFAQWVKNQNGQAVWDIYSYNRSPDVAGYFNELDAPTIFLKEGLPYEKLSSVLAQYDVGVILYKGVITNHIYSIPNKLYEYHTCGLDVWFPKTLLSSRLLEDSTALPKIVSIDFENLAENNLVNLCQRQGLKIRQDHYFCEEVLQPLIHKLTET